MKRSVCRIAALFAAVLAVSLFSPLAHASGLDVPLEGNWITDGEVDAAVSSGGKIYIGGSFTRVGPNTGSAAPLSAATGLTLASFPRFNDTVSAITPDGSGGWYIGGSFTSVDTRAGAVARAGLAHVLANGELDAQWDPSPASSYGGPVSVDGLAVFGSTVCVCGSFDRIGGQDRRYLAAVDAVTGAVFPWTPEPGSFVSGVVVNGGTLYVYGQFAGLAGANRNYVAAFDAGSGVLTDWDARVIGGGVNALAFSGNVVYVGGSFNSIGGQSRTRIAALDATTGDATNWAPNANGEVRALAVSGSTVYAGGIFTTIGGQSRRYIAALDAESNSDNATVWNPGADNPVNALAINGNVVYAGGDFSYIGGRTRPYAAALDATTGVATAWNPCPNNTAAAFACSGDVVYTGGRFMTIGGVVRNNLAALDAATGRPTDWNPDADNAVYSLAIEGNTVYAGGLFRFVGLQDRKALAAISAATGEVTSWKADVAGRSGNVYSVFLNGNVLYAGGDFSSVGGVTRNYAAALDAASGAVSSWDPAADGVVYAFAVLGSTVYAGGYFTHIGAEPRNYIASWDTTTGALLPWKPNMGNGVSVLAAKGSMVYAGGSFESVDGETRNYAAAWDASGALSSWDPHLDGSVFSPNAAVYVLYFNGKTLYAGGRFNAADGQPRCSIAALDAATGRVADWNPVQNEELDVYAMAVAGDMMYASGYSNFSSMPRTFFSRFAACVSAAPEVPVSSNTVVGPSTGGTLTLAAESGSITVTVPAGTFGSAVTLTLSTAAVPSSNQDTVRPTNIGIEVTNNLGLQPSRAITITISYRDADIAGLDESRLAIARWDNGRWVPLPSVVDAAANTVTCTVRHLSTFAIVQLIPARDLAGVRAYPNPYHPGNGQFVFENLTGDTEIKLYTVAGELVRTLSPSSTGRVAWDGKNDGGNEVASGVYLAFIKGSAGTKKIKIAVER